MVDKHLVIGLISFCLAYLVVGLGALAATTALGVPYAWREIVSLDVLAAGCAVAFALYFGRITLLWVIAAGLLMTLDLRIATNFAIGVMISGGQCGNLDWATLLQPFFNAGQATLFGLQVFSPLLWLLLARGWNTLGPSSVSVS